MPVGSKLLALLSTSFRLHPFTILCRTHNFHHPLAAFSSSTSSHGRLHSVFIFPKLMSCNSAANQFHSEEIINKGYAEVVTSFSDTRNSHPWPEWSNFSNLLVEKGFSDRCVTSVDNDDAFLVEKDLPEEFLKASKACISFARDRPDILRLLAKKNIEDVVLNGSPFLFKNGDNSARRMKLFLSGEGSNELELEKAAIQELKFEKAQTIDIMRYLLSYAYVPLSSSDENNLKSDELVERSARKLLRELFNLSGTVWEPKSVHATLTKLPLSNQQLSILPGQYTEMRSGDCIYPKNPARSSTASENQSSAWSSSFTNTEKQKQGPEETPSSQTSGMNLAQPSSSVLEEKRESCSSSRVTTSNGRHSLNETNAAYGTYYGKPSDPSGNPWPKINTSYSASTTNSPHPHPPGNTWIDHDRYTYGRSTTNSSQPPNNSWDNYNTSNGRYNTVNSTQPFYSSNSNTPYGFGSTVNSSQPPSNNSWDSYNTSNGRYSAVNSSQPPNNCYVESSENPPNRWNNSRETYNGGLASQSHRRIGGENGNNGYSGMSLEGSCVKEADPLDMSEEAKAERWFRRAAQIKDISELSQIPDEDFPQIMPMRKGVNRFVVSKRKTPLERRLASQQYKTNIPLPSSSQPEKDPTDGDTKT